MHYYKRNIGDYAKKAGKLSMLQHGAYTLLIDACYDRENFPTMEQAIEWTWASTSEQIEAVEFVLRKFFTLECGVYVQKRIQEELDDYWLKAATNKRIAIERETKRKDNSTNRARTDHEPPPNHKPITKNHKTPPTPSRFEEFWLAYPKKVGKGAAEKSWLKQKPPLADVLAAIATQSQSDQWRKDGGQFIPNPATWLNQRRWLDSGFSAGAQHDFMAGAI